MTDPVATLTDGIPRDMSRPARLLFFAAWAARGGEPGEIEGGHATLRKLAGYEDPEQARRAIAECEAHHLIKRVRHTRRQYVFFLGLSGSEGGTCSHCGLDPIRPQRGGKECAKCLQIVVRRGWIDELLAIWVAGSRQPGVTDWTIARRAAARLRRPLWTRAEDDGQGGGSGKGEGIIPAGIRIGIFPEEMLEYDPAGHRGLTESWSSGGRNEAIGSTKD